MTARGAGSVTILADGMFGMPAAITEGRMSNSAPRMSRRARVTSWHQKKDYYAAYWN
ncbi:MAG: hypothetical protein NVS2B7_04150 [Herpetosiphon sp.]